MSEMFENAVASIRMGIEDYQSNDERRPLSAVRNYYSGLLLLAKEVLVRAVPEATLEEVIGAGYRPVPDEAGGVKYERDSNKTIDLGALEKRLKDFGVSVTVGPLQNLNKIRNDIEHKSTAHSRETMLFAIAETFPVAAQLFRHAREEPAIVLGETWKIIVESAAVYEAELATCRASTSVIEWRSATVSEAGLFCPHCASALVRQKVTENTRQDLAEFACSSCGADVETHLLIEATLEENQAGETYTRAKDAGEDGPIFHCPSCDCDCFVDFEFACANCGETVEDSNCVRCENSLTMEELLADEAMCNDCTWQHDKIMAE